MIKTSIPKRLKISRRVKGASERDKPITAFFQLIDNVFIISLVFCLKISFSFGDYFRVTNFLRSEKGKGGCGRDPNDENGCECHSKSTALKF